MTSRPIRALYQSGLRRVTLAAALMLGFGIGAAQANEGAKSNGCPWAQDVTLVFFG